MSFLSRGVNDVLISHPSVGLHTKTYLLLRMPSVSSESLSIIKVSTHSLWNNPIVAILHPRFQIWILDCHLILALFLFHSLTPRLIRARSRMALFHACVIVDPDSREFEFESEDKELALWDYFVENACTLRLLTIFRKKRKGCKYVTVSSVVGVTLVTQAYYDDFRFSWETGTFKSPVFVYSGFWCFEVERDSTSCSSPEEAQSPSPSVCLDVCRSTWRNPWIVDS